jgi:hypothetical protein
MMRNALVAAAAVLLSSLGLPSGAPAQGLPGPRGTYQSSCTNVQLYGDVLVATCRTSDGRLQQSSLAGVNRCVGNIDNNGGALRCSYADGTQGRGTAEPAYGAAPAPAPRGYNAATVQHCQDLHRQAAELHAQVNEGWSVMQNSRLAWQDRQVRSQEARCPP